MGGGGERGVLRGGRGCFFVFVFGWGSGQGDGLKCGLCYPGV